jgi:hypothetical protein
VSSVSRVNPSDHIRSKHRVYLNTESSRRVLSAPSHRDAGAVQLISEGRPLSVMDVSRRTATAAWEPLTCTKHVFRDVTECTHAHRAPFRSTSLPFASVLSITNLLKKPYERRRRGRLYARSPARGRLGHLVVMLPRSTVCRHSSPRLVNSIRRVTY